LPSFTPSIVTTVPPVAGPLLGELLLTTGTALVYVKPALLTFV
jgi:hypothetical protein